jgi:hypothetical protein
VRRREKEKGRQIKARARRNEELLICEWVRTRDVNDPQRREASATALLSPLFASIIDDTQRVTIHEEKRTFGRLTASGTALRLIVCIKGLACIVRAFQGGFKR